MRRVSTVFPAACLAAAAFVFGSCGGGGGTAASSPTSPTPSPVSPPPAGGVCGIFGGAQGIVNGTVCSPANSSVVLVNLRDASGQPSGSCSGTVIAPRAVLTAAHCLVGDTVAVRIYPGSGLAVPAASFQASPGYKENDPSSLDVGVVLTTEDLNRAAIPLLLSRDARVGEQAIIAGWGNDQLGNGTILRAGTTTIASVGANFLVTAYSSTTSAVCSGDSGGPLLLLEGGVWAIAGITSATSVGGACTLGSDYYANVWNPDIMSFILGLVPNAARQ